MTSNVTISNDVPKEASGLVLKMKLVDDMDSELTVKSIRLLESNRRNIYKQQVNQLSESSNIALSVECRPSDEEDGDIIEKLIVVDKDFKKTEDIILECKISLEEFSPSGLIEYTFNDKDWLLSAMSLASLEYYKKSKFKNWKEMIEKPDCQAAFKRLLNIGVITSIFDHVAFPSPEHEKQDWEVKDKNNKTVIIPRPVKSLRVWNVSKRNYDTISPHLEGAPKPEEKENFWNEMMKKFRIQYGDEYIDELLTNNDNNNNNNKN